MERGGGRLSIVARRDNGRAVLRETPTLARRAHGRAAHTYGTEALSVSTEEVGRAHAHREREAEARRGASFPVSKFPALAIRGARGYTIDPHLPVRSD